MLSDYSLDSVIKACDWMYDKQIMEFDVTS